jgi:hypothetical protein
MDASVHCIRIASFIRCDLGFIDLEEMARQLTQSGEFGVPKGI